MFPTVAEASLRKLAIKGCRRMPRKLLRPATRWQPFVASVVVLRFADDAAPVKVCKLGDNVESLSKKPDAQLSDLLTKAGGASKFQTVARFARINLTKALQNMRSMKKGR